MDFSACGYIPTCRTREGSSLLSSRSGPALKKLALRRKRESILVTSIRRISLCVTRKRELTDDVEAQPDTKRARIDDDTDVMQEETERIAVEQEAVEEATSSTIAGEAIDVDAESSLPDAEEPVDVGVEADAEAEVIGVAEEVADAPQPSGPTMRIGRKLARGEGGFKENPYTFLAPDDPVLVSCLCVPSLCPAI